MRRGAAVAWLASLALPASAAWRSSAAMPFERQHESARTALRAPLRASAATCASAGSCTTVTPPARCTAPGPAAPSCVGAGEHDAEQALAVDVGRRLEQHVDRRPRVMHRLVDRQRELRPGVDQQVVVGRREVDRARLHRLLVLRPRAPAARSCGAKISASRLGPLARQVQHDEHRRRAGPRGSAGSSDDERLDAAGRGADHDRVDARPRRARRCAHAASRFWIDALARATSSSKASACAEKRSDSFEPMPRKPLRHSDSRNSPSARSCSARSK